MAGSSSDACSSDNDSWDLNSDTRVGSEEVAQHTLEMEVQMNGENLLTREPQNLTDGQDLVPKVGMQFQSETQAYNFYNVYAMRVGFSVRKNSVKRSRNGQIKKRQYVCSKEGFRVKDSRRSPKKPRAHTRTNCRACINFKVVDGKWIVIKFVKEHNHSLASESEAHLLRSQRKILLQQARYINSMCFGEFGSSQVFSVMRAEHGKSQHLNVTEKDCNSYYLKRWKEIYKEGEAQVALNYFRRMQREDPTFSYALQVDQANQICNLFWADAKSKIDYDFFGDVVCFDTTFRTNPRSMPCVPIVGVNHHGMTVLFGCALLLDESTDSFVWLFESFLNAMSGKQPKTILIDQDPAIANAIEQLMPNTHHRICLWHIYQNAAKHLSHVYEVNKQFKKDFKKCIYNAETEEEFQSEWESMLHRYDLSGNEWLRGLYELQQKWAPVYGREHFCAGMTTIQQSESVNNFFEDYLKNTLCITEFLAHYEKAVLNRRENEVMEDFKTKQTDPILTSRSSFEKQAAQVYTRNVFKIFQDGFRNFACYLDQIEEESGSMYIYKVEVLDEIRHDRNWRVAFNSEANTVECNCKSFEFTGILCIHAVKVLHRRRIFEVPSRYILKRWTKNAKVGYVIDDTGIAIQADSQKNLSLRYSDLAHRALTFAVKGAVDEESSLLVKRILTKGLEELDAYQRKTQLETTHVEDIGCQRHENTEKESNACHTNQGFFGNLGQSIQMHTSGAVPHFSEELLGNQGQSIPMHTSGAFHHFNQEPSVHQGQSIMMQTSGVVPQFSQESFDSTHRLKFL